MSTAPYRPVGLAVSLAVFAAAGALQVQPAAAQDASISSLATVDQAELAEHRAGTVIIAADVGEALIAQNEQNVTGTSSGNTVNANSADSGDITLDDSALEGARGMVNTTINTGANALVQGIMSLTIVINE